MEQHSKGLIGMVKSQFVRFEQLSKIINKDIFSINDIGCGYGKYFEYLQNRF